MASVTDTLVKTLIRFLIIVMTYGPAIIKCYYISYCVFNCHWLVSECTEDLQLKYRAYM